MPPHPLVLPDVPGGRRLGREPDVTLPRCEVPDQEPERRLLGRSERQKRNEIYRWNGGRGVYFLDPAGHFQPLPM
jgi:hypothetical protein